MGKLLEIWRRVRQDGGARVYCGIVQRRGRGREAGGEQADNQN